MALPLQEVVSDVLVGHKPATWLEGAVWLHRFWWRQADRNLIESMLPYVRPDILMILSSFTDDLIHSTGWAAFLWLEWTATAGTSRRIWEEDPSNQTVHAGGELVESLTFFLGKCLTTSKVLRRNTERRNQFLLIWCFGGIRMASTSSLWCSLRSVR